MGFVDQAKPLALLKLLGSHLFNVPTQSASRENRSSSPAWFTEWPREILDRKFHKVMAQDLPIPLFRRSGSKLFAKLSFAILFRKALISSIAILLVLAMTIGAHSMI